MPDELLTGKAVSDETEIPEKTLAQWRYQKIGPTYLKLGAHVRYRRSDLEAWLASCERPTNAA
jgi:hypothetical protein